MLLESSGGKYTYRNCTMHKQKYQERKLICNSTGLCTIFDFAILTGFKVILQQDQEHNVHVRCWWNDYYSKLSRECISHTMNCFSIGINLLHFCEQTFCF